MLSLPVFEVRIDMESSQAKSYSQMFIGKPTLEEVLEKITSLPHEDYWVQLLEKHGLPEYLFIYNTHSEYIEYCRHMEVPVAQIKIVQHPSIPVADDEFLLVLDVVRGNLDRLSAEYYNRGGQRDA